MASRKSRRSKAQRARTAGETQELPSSFWSKSRKGLAAGVVVVLTAAFAAVFTPLGSAITDFVSERVLGKDPLSIVVSRNADEVLFDGHAKDGTYIFYKESSSIPAPPEPSNNCANRYTWAHDNGGDDWGTTYGQFSLYARSKNVQIIAGSLRIVEKLENKRGVVLSCQRGDETTARHIEINLKERSLTFDLGDHQPKPFALKLAPGGTELVQFIARAYDQSYSWVIDLSVVIDGTPKTVTVDNNGKPFRTMYSEVNGFHRWVDGKWSNSY